MKQITLFSTKTLDEDGCLFYGGEPIKAPSILEDYFVKIEELVNACKVCNKLDLLKDTLIQECSKHKKPILYKDIECLKREKEKKKNGKKGINLETIYKSHIDFEIENFDDDNCFIDLCTRIIEWDLKDILKGWLVDCNAFENAANRARLLKLRNDDVYAIKDLDDDEEDKEKGRKWIPTLIQCAKELAGNVPTEINLVLHDKDLGREENKFAVEEYIITEYQVLDEFNFPEVKELLQDESICRIIFFQHGHNIYSRILKGDDCLKCNVHEKIALASSVEYLSLINKSLSKKDNNINQYVIGYNKCIPDEYKQLRFDDSIINNLNFSEAKSQTTQKYNNVLEILENG